MRSAMLDTRSPSRASRRPLHRPVVDPPMETRGFSVDLGLFRRLVRVLIIAPRRDRAEIAAKVVKHVRESRRPLECLKHLLFECAADGGTDGLDIAVDVLARVGHAVLVTADRFLKIDLARWEKLNLHRHSVNDDVWYALIRGIARADLPGMQKMMAMTQMLRTTTPSSVIEAVAHALGDLACAEPRMRQFVRAVLNHLANHASPAVRETTAEVLRDMEG